MRLANAGDGAQARRREAPWHGEHRGCWHARDRYGPDCRRQPNTQVPGNRRNATSARLVESRCLLVAWVVSAEPGHGLLLVAYPVDSYRSHSHSQVCALQSLCGWRIKRKRPRNQRIGWSEPWTPTRRERRSKRIQTRDVFSGQQKPHRTPRRPAFALVRACVEPPAGIEPATPSLPWILHSPLCGPEFVQVGRDRRPRSNVLLVVGPIRGPWLCCWIMVTRATWLAQSDPRRSRRQTSTCHR